MTTLWGEFSINEDEKLEHKGLQGICAWGWELSQMTPLKF